MNEIFYNENIAAAAQQMAQAQNVPEGLCNQFLHPSLQEQINHLQARVAALEASARSNYEVHLAKLKFVAKKYDIKWEDIL